MPKPELKKSIEERVALFEQFYARKNERPLLGFFCGSEYPIHRYEAAKGIPVGLELHPDDFPIEPYLDDCDRLFEIHEQCGGDFIWSASAYWGIPWLEAALGCPIILSSYESGSIHAVKPPGYDGPESLPAFSLDNPWVRKTIEFLEGMARHGGGRYPLGTTRMRGISDLLAVLYGGEQFVFEMMTNPDEVLETAGRLRDFWIEFGRMQIERIPAFHGGIGSFYYNAWAFKGTIWHQEDAAALLSPALFEQFIKPFDAAIVEAFDHCIMHQHSTGYVPFEHYLEMSFTALELHIDEAGPSAEKLFDTHTRILKRKPLIIWGDIPERDLDWIFSKLPPRGLAVITVVDSPQQAEAIWHKHLAARY
jgi:hypothetical protein